ncbi:hypothetical protein MKX83_24180 [Cytobacillus sp. FSL M8-0252]|uniref:hypothetical protein n=1 Tax=Cytobacillus sp. FSL M8-0252 TaxID=2921621 RepID=UPI0030F9B73B
MNKHAIIKVLQELSYYNRFTSLDSARANILNEARRRRKGLTKEEIIQKGLNIYPKQGINIDKLIEQLIDEDYIEVEHKNDIEAQITSKGTDYLMELYTENYSESFLTYRDKVDSLTKTRGETDFDPVHVGKMFYLQWSIDEIEKIYFTEKEIQDRAVAFHEYMIDKYGLKPSVDDYLFHLIPKLFLPVEDMNEEVELSIKGIDLPEQPIILDRPYPNKRYIVGGVKIGKETFTTGFYPIIASKNEFPKEKDISYHWKLSNGKEIIHDIHIQFEVDRGNLFSTEQSLSRSNDLSSIRLATFLADTPLSKNRQKFYYGDENNRVLHIKENVVLTSFPIRLHYCFSPDKNYEKWKNKIK